MIPTLSYFVFDSENPLPLHYAEELSLLFRSIYGPLYHPAVLNQPSFIVDEIGAGRWIAIAALSSGGSSCPTLVGHGGLLQSSQGEWKFARWIVNPSCQGRGIAKTLLEKALALQASLPHQGPFLTEALASQSRSQNIFESYGLFPTAIYPGKFNDYFNCGMRESTILYSKIFAGKQLVVNTFLTEEVDIVLKALLPHITFVGNLDTYSRNSIKEAETTTSLLTGMNTLHTSIGKGKVSVSQLEQLFQYPNEPSYHGISLYLDEYFSYESLSLLIDYHCIVTGVEIGKEGVAISLCRKKPCSLDVLNKLSFLTEKAGRLLREVQSRVF